MKTIWKGSLSFGLVTIRVQLFSAVQEHAIGFKLLHNKCHNPISYKRWCTHCNKEIEWDDVVKGLKLDDGSYFIVTPEKLKELRPKTTDRIDIVEFVVSSQLPSIYLEDHYYLLPQKGSEKEFYLFKKALAESDKIAIGTFVMRDKQYTCAINPFQDILLLTTLSYEYEIRPAPALTAYKPKDKKTEAMELKLALQLINNLSVKKLDLSQFKDTFMQQLKDAIKKGKKEKLPKAKKEKKTEKQEKSSSLVSTLRKSLTAPGARAEQPAYARAKSKSAKKK